MSIIKPKILIVEDELLTAQGIASDVEANGYSVVGLYDSGEGAIKSLSDELPDLILMDIILQGSLNGIETAKKINQKYRIPIIYLTNLKETENYVKSKDTFPRNYLTKPFQTHQLLFAIDLALTKSKSHRNLGFTEKYGFFNTLDNSKSVKVAFEEIKYLKSEGQYCSIVLKSREKLQTSYPMKEVFKKIPYGDIIRVSRSYCVNLNEIEAISGNLIHLEGEEPIVIGETYRGEVKTILNMF